MTSASKRVVFIRGDLFEFADRGHSLTVDHGWRDVADACLDWLDKHGL